MIKRLNALSTRQNRTAIRHTTKLTPLGEPQINEDEPTSMIEINKV